MQNVRQMPNARIQVAGGMRRRGTSLLDEDDDNKKPVVNINDDQGEEVRAREANARVPAGVEALLVAAGVSFLRVATVERGGHAGEVACRPAASVVCLFEAFRLEN